MARIKISGNIAFIEIREQEDDIGSRYKIEDQI